jgi:hypothetical protein
MQSIFITGDCRVSSAEPVHAHEMVNMTMGATLNIFNTILSQVPEADQTKCRHELYDLFNAGASAFLKVFDPEAELHPDLTEEAILRAENEIIMERAAELGKDEVVTSVDTEEVLIPLSSLDKDGKPVKHPHLTEVK